MTNNYNAENGVMNTGSGAISNVVAGRGNRQKVSGSVDVSLAPLADELKRFYQVVSAAGPERAGDADAVRDAVDAIDANDTSQLRAAFMRMSRWALTVAQTIGLDLVATELGKHL